METVWIIAISVCLSTMINAVMINEMSIQFYNRCSRLHSFIGQIIKSR